MDAFQPYSLKGKIILITGASSGIGRQCALTCNELGADVIILGRNSERLNETWQTLHNSSNSFMYNADLTDYDSIQKIITNLHQKKITINGLINAAGISTTLPLKVITEEKLRQFFEINVISAVHLTKLVSSKKIFNHNGGSIIFISSVMGMVGAVGKTMYSLTKGALISGVKSLALELAPRKIRVNAISPGVVETPMSKSAIYSQDKDSLNKIKALHPLGLGSPKDIAYACAFLLSDASRWVTGINLVIDGGYTAR
ncbi:SDR family NAD(P)-dependent oxidoreductase [Calditrichota bacterium GD2]